MSGEKRAYHHGNLEKALQEEAIKILQNEGESALSLRDLGRRLGVSRTAPYRHFKDKEALLIRLAETGFNLLTQSMLDEVASRKPDNAREHLNALGHGYVRFAYNQPGHFRLIFGRRFCDSHHTAQLRAAGAQAYNCLKLGVERCQKDGIFAGTDPEIPTLHCWTTVHGYATLLLSEMIDMNSYEHLLDSLFDSMYYGLKTSA